MDSGLYTPGYDCLCDAGFAFDANNSRTIHILEMLISRHLQKSAIVFHYIVANVLQVAAGSDFTCVLMEYEQIKSYGRNNYGQLGILGSTQNMGDDPGDIGNNLPIVDLGFDSLKWIDAGASHRYM